MPDLVLEAGFEFALEEPDVYQGGQFGQLSKIADLGAAQGEWWKAEIETAGYPGLD